MKVTGGVVGISLTVMVGALTLFYAKQGTAGAVATLVDKDAEAIRKLHELDMAASRFGDFETLRSLMTDDAVFMPPGTMALRGRRAVAEHTSRLKEAMSQVEVLDYVLDFKEVKILGVYAYEWGEIRGRTRIRSTGKEESYTFNVMRILQKQPDGSWKVHRSIWNAGPTA